jgi:hypothetical protein
MSDKSTPAATARSDPLVDALKAITSEAVKGLGNKISIEGASFPATILAYRGMAGAAGKIADAVRAERPKCVLVQTWDDGVDLAALRSFLAITRVLQARMQAEIDAAQQHLAEPQTGQLNIIGEVIAAAVPAGLALWQLFSQKEITEKHFAVTVDSRALMLLVARNLRRHGTEVVFPSTLAQSFSDAAEEPLPGRLRQRLDAIRRQGDELRDALGRISQRLVAKEPPPDSDRLAGVKAQLEATARVLSALDDALPGAGPLLFRGDEAQARLRDSGYILSVQVLAGGGSSRTETNHLGRDRIEHSGGAIVGYTLADANGNVVLSDILPEHMRTEETDNAIEPWVDSGL